MAAPLELVGSGVRSALAALVDSPVGSAVAEQEGGLVVMAQREPLGD